MPEKNITPRKPKESIMGNNIKSVMEKKGMSQQELADLLNIDAGFMSRIINQRKCISLPIAMSVAKVLETPVEQLFYKK